MKTSCIFSLLLLISYSTFAQVVTPLIVNGPIDELQNIVIFADGYLASEESKFITDATTIAEGFLETSPYKEYQNFYNFYGIFRASNENGADHPGTATDVTEPDHPVSMVDTYYNSTFDFNGIHRLLVPQNTTAIYVDLLLNFQEYDAVLVLVNSPYYGGSGGTGNLGDIAASSIETTAIDIAIHEIAHSYTDLADEYYPGDIFSAEKPNMTADSDPATIKWKDWLFENDVGIHQHTCSGGAGDSQCGSWYRPHQDCKMRFLASEFCSVCKQAFIDVLYSSSDPRLGKFPATGNVLLNYESSLSFGDDIIFPVPNTLEIEWYLNMARLPSRNGASEVFDYDSFELGVNGLVMIIRDKTSLSKNDYEWANGWSVTKSELCENTVTITTTSLDGYSNSFNVGSDEGQATNEDAFYWQVNSGPTPTPGTGPPSGFTGATYLYIESDPVGQKTAIWDTDCLNISNTIRPFFSGNTFMFGEDVGTLEFLVSTDGGMTFSTLQTYMGSISNSWRNFKFDLIPYRSSELKIRVKATTKDMVYNSGNVQGDIAIDNFKVLDDCLAFSGDFSNTINHIFENEFYVRGSINSSARVLLGRTLYDAVNSITLDVGFEVKPGAIFTAQMGSCEQGN